MAAVRAPASQCALGERSLHVSADPPLGPAPSSHVNAGTCVSLPRSLAAARRCARAGSGASQSCHAALSDSCAVAWQRGASPAGTRCYDVLASKILSTRDSASPAHISESARPFAATARSYASALASRQQSLCLRRHLSTHCPPRSRGRPTRRRHCLAITALRF